MKKLLLITMAIAVTMFSCDENIMKNELNEKDGLTYKMSLEEFAKSVETDEEKHFFKTHAVIDYSDICAQAMQSVSNENDFVKKRFKIKFRWFVGCERAFGICLIIPIGIADVNANASMFMYGGKCIIVPDSEEDNGLTDDGFLPVFCDIPVNDNFKIKEGIYASYYDENAEKSVIAVDVVR
jgi:hypothetical protein